jgi:hypothetical protein
VSGRRVDVVRAQIAHLADDVGRLRAHLPEAIDSYDGFLAERIAHRVETLDALTWPTAADFFRHFVAEGIDEEKAVAAALEASDDHASSVRSALRLRP